MSRKSANVGISIAILLLAVDAGAQPADPDPDQLGLYWDTAATEVCLEAAPFTTIPFYVCYTRPSVAAVEGFEMGLDLVGQGILLDSGSCVGLTVEPPQDGNYFVPFFTPLVCSEVTVLCMFQVFYMATDWARLDLVLRAPEGGSVPGFPAVWVPDQGPLAVGFSTGAPGPSARINGDCDIAALDLCSWDAVKSIYR